MKQYISNDESRQQTHSKTSLDNPMKYYTSTLIAVIVAIVLIVGVMMWYKQKEEQLMREFINSK